MVGRVTSGTSGGTVPVGLPVALHVFSGAEEIQSFTTTIASDGSFRFANLTPWVGETFVARVAHQGANYFSELGAFEDEQQEIWLPVTVYEATEDPAAVQVTQMHAFLTREGDRLQVEEYYVLGNAADRTYVGREAPEAGRRSTVDFVLPAGARGLGFGGSGLGERFIVRPGGFSDTRAVPPGAEAVEVFFRYELAFEEGRPIVRVLDVPVASVVLVVLGGDVALSGAGIGQPRALDTAVGPALSYTAGPLAAAEPLEFMLVTGPGLASGLPQSAPARNTRLEMSLGLMALAIGMMAATLLWRAPRSAPLPAPARPLVEAITALDAEFEAGRLPEHRYRAERDALKQQIRARLDR